MYFLGGVICSKEKLGKTHCFLNTFSAGLLRRDSCKTSPSAVSLSLCISLESPVHSSSRREWTAQPHFIALRSQLRSIHEMLYSTNQGTLRALYKFITRNNPFSALQHLKNKIKDCRKRWGKVEPQKHQILLCSVLPGCLSTRQHRRELGNPLHRRGMETLRGSGWDPSASSEDVPMWGEGLSQVFFRDNGGTWDSSPGLDHITRVSHSRSVLGLGGNRVLSCLKKINT